MRRSSNFKELLEVAKTRPDLSTALRRLGFQLKRVGHGSKYNCTEYKIATGKGVSGDFSALVFCENADGTWRVLDNKQRYGRLAYDAIGCLTEFFGHNFDEAVYALSNGVALPVRDRMSVVKDDTPLPSVQREPFKLPAKTEGKYSALFAYLCNRGISNELIKNLVEAELLFQTDVKTSSGKTMPAVVFPVYDKCGKAVGADSCGTYNFYGFKYKHVYSGSDPSYGWRFANHVTDVTEQTPIFFCESPIDAMSLCMLTGYEGVYVSMAGCKDVTLEGIAKSYGGKPVICTDNDEAGNKFRERHPTAASLKPTFGKDWNDELKFRIENKIPYAHSPKQMPSVRR